MHHLASKEEEVIYSEIVLYKEQPYPAKNHPENNDI